jgi:membrane associated rhomboid family serine protease
VAFARTGRTGYLAIVLALGAATAVLTVMFASFGPLVAMQLLIAPVLGLVALGRPKQLRRRTPPRPAD